MGFTKIFVAKYEEEVMKIEIVHNYQNGYQWDIFYAQLVDESKPDGEKIRASASGDWKFINKVVESWIKEYKEIRYGPQS